MGLVKKKNQKRCKKCSLYYDSNISRCGWCGVSIPDEADTEKKKESK